MKHLQELHERDRDIERLWIEPNADLSEAAEGSVVPLTTDQELNHLKATIDELEASLEKANRRIHRLLGEKKQIATWLDKRDEQLQHLNREFGRYAPISAGDVVQNGKMRILQEQTGAFLSSIAERVRGALTKQTRFGEPESVCRQSVAADSGKASSLVVHRDDEVAKSIVIVLVLGMDKAQIEQLLPTIERDCSSRGLMPLYLVDIDAFELLRERKSVFEYLPPADDRDRFDPSLNWDLYIQRRLALIRRKWDPVRIVSFGEIATKTLALWSSSPFEETALPAVVGETSGQQQT